jgi:multiple sugar transport system substrate-binding protein
MVSWTARTQRQIPHNYLLANNFWSNAMLKRIVALLLLISVLLAACSQQENNNNGTADHATPATPPSTQSPTHLSRDKTPPVPAYEGEVITLRFLTDQWSRDRYHPLINSFEADNPDIKIEVITYDDLSTSEPVGDVVEQTLRYVSAADVVDNIALPETVAHGLILDLTPFFAESGLDTDDFFPGILESAQWGGGTWYFPTRASFHVIYYDKDAFDQAGLPYPEPGWRWDDFLAAARALTLPGEDEMAQWGFVEPTHFNPALFIESRTGPLLDLTVEPPLIGFDDTAVIEAVRWYTELFALHEVAPYFPWPEPGEPAHANILIHQEGKAAMWVDWVGNWPRQREEMNVGVAPFPVDAPGAASTPMQVSGLFVSAGTTKAEAAWRWLLFLSQNATSTDGVTPPVRHSVAAASGFWDNIDEEVAPTLGHALDHAYTSLPGVGAERYIRQVVEAILIKGQSVESALFEVQVTAEDDFAEMMAKTDPIDDFIVAPPVATPIEEGDTVIEFMIAGSPTDQQVFQALAAEFRETQPGITVQITLRDATGTPATFRQMAGRADCFQWARPPDEDDLDAVISLDPLFDASPDLAAGDFLPATLAPFTYEGQLWGIPGQFHLNLVAFNKALFDAAGLPYPQTEWTPDEMLALAVALTTGQAESRQYGYLPGSFVDHDLNIFLELLGAQLVDESQQPPLLTLNHPSTVNAMRWYTSLATEYGVMPLPAAGPSQQREQRQELIENGQAAMWMASGFDLAGVTGFNTAQGRVGFVPLPLAPGGARSYQSATAYFISAGTDMAQPCWQWLTFLAAQPLIGETSFTIPALRVAAESAVYRQAVGVEKAAAMLNALSETRQKPFLQRYSSEDNWLAVAYWWLADAYEQVVQEGLGVEDALAVAQEKAGAYRECLLADNAFGDAEAQQQCRRQVEEAIAIP